MSVAIHNRAQSATPHTAGGSTRTPIIITNKRKQSAATTFTTESTVAHSAAASVSSSAGVTSTAASSMARPFTSTNLSRAPSSLAATALPDSPHDDLLPRSAHAERMVQMALSVEAARVLAASLAPPSSTSLAIAAAATAKQRALLATSSAAAARPLWSMCMDESHVRTRHKISVPISRMLTFPKFMGLFSERGKTPEGVLALFLAAMWLYASATPPETPEHVASVVVPLSGAAATAAGQVVELASDAVYAAGAQRVGSVMVASGGGDAQQRRKNTAILGGGITNPAAAAAASGQPPQQRDGILGNHWTRPLSGAASGPRPISSPGFHFFHGSPPEDLATVADSILLFLMDDQLTATRDGQPKRHFRPGDRRLLDHWLRGHPEVITRFCTVENNPGTAAVPETDAERKARLKRERAERKQKREDEKKAREAAGLQEEHEGERTWNVSLKDSSDDDTSEEDEDEDEEDEADGNRPPSSGIPGFQARPKSRSQPSSSSCSSSSKTNGDSLTFTIEENLFSADSTSLGLPGSSGAPDSRTTTRFLSLDSFSSSLLPVRLKQDRQSSGMYRVWDWYPLLHGMDGREPMKEVVIPQSGVLEVAEKHLAATPALKHRSRLELEREEKARAMTLRAEAQEREEKERAQKMMERKRGSIFQMMQSGSSQAPYNPLSQSILSLASPVPPAHSRHGSASPCSGGSSGSSSGSTSRADSPNLGSGSRPQSGSIQPRAQAGGLRPFTPSKRQPY